MSVFHFLRISQIFEKEKRKKHFFIDYLFVVDEWNDRRHQYHLDQPRELHRVERLHLEFPQRATNDYS